MINKCSGARVRMMILLFFSSFVFDLKYEFDVTNEPEI